MPSPFGDFNKVLATLPGVVSNSELSSTYSVRGGNYNENLVYVNDMEIYRPFLVSSGQQEGLSFVNPDMVKSVDFSTGGFQARYGDKLSSVLNVQYKTPKKFAGSFSLGVLTQTAHIEGADSSGRISFVTGFRRKDARYLFSGSKFIKGFDVKGEYLPQFVDAQSFVTIDLTGKERRKKDPNRTTLGILNAFARNRYTVRPASRETQFGTIQRVLRLYTAYDGEESLNYDTWQTGIRLSHRWTPSFRSDFVPSFVSTRERERVDFCAFAIIALFDPDGREKVIAALSERRAGAAPTLRVGGAPKKVPACVSILWRGRPAAAIAPAAKSRYELSTPSSCACEMAPETGQPAAPVAQSAA
jgi:hypothetical protein